VIAFGLLSVPPFLLIVVALFGICGCYTESSKNKWKSCCRQAHDDLVDFWYKKIVRKAGYVRSSRRRELAQAPVDYFNKIAPFVHTTMHKKDSWHLS
jgi:hypothetical protein